MTGRRICDENYRIEARQKGRSKKNDRFHREHRVMLREYKSRVARVRHTEFYSKLNHFSWLKFLRLCRLTLTDAAGKKSSFMLFA